MTKKAWTFQIDGTQNTVELEHGVWSRDRTITVNGQVIERSKPNKFFETGSEHRFEVRGCACILRIRITFDFEYELFVDGRLV
jgi:hypothetical protein